MNKIKNILPSKSFFRGFIACLIFTQFISVEVNFRKTESYAYLADRYALLEGGVAVDEKPREFVSVTPDVFEACNNGGC